MFLSNGIMMQKSVPHVLQQNGRVERKHRHLLQMSKALRFQQFYLRSFGGDYVLTATYLINKLPTKRVFGMKTFDVGNGFK